MYIIVRPCEMALINKFHEAWFVSVTNVSLLDVSFFCLLLNVARLSLYEDVDAYFCAREVSANWSVSRCARK